MQDEFTDDEIFAQIAANQKAMSDVIQSQQAEIERLKFRVKRLENKGA
jgi:hypothetical protein